jgi:hypothetical protein
MPAKGCGDGLAVCGKGGISLELKDHSTVTGCEGMLGLLDRRLLDDGASLYSLIDGAKFSALSRITLPATKSIECHSLLGEAAIADAFYAGPVLIWHKERENCTLLRRLLQEQDSAEFLSLIISAECLPDTLRRLTWLTEVRHEDGTEWVMRYYDPLILPHWLNILDVEQREKALSGKLQWLFQDMRGIDQAVDMGTIRVSEILDTRPMLLVDRQCDDLMRAAMPYIVMSQLLSDDPQALENISKSQRYDFMDKQIEVAKNLDLLSPLDLKIFCKLAVMFGPEISKHPVISQTAAKKNEGISFSEKVMKWSPDIWDSIELDMSPLSPVNDL